MLLNQTNNSDTHNCYISKDIYHQQVLWEKPCISAVELDEIFTAIKHNNFAHLSVVERTHLLLDFAQRLESNKQHLAIMICEEVGRGLKECEAELNKSIELIRYYAHLAPELLASKTIATQASLSKVRFEPLGTVFAVMPWNYPIWQILRFAIPALCAGNACVVKPAPSVGRVTQALFELVGDDLPFAVAFIAHQDVETAIAAADAFAFTGSAQTGKYLASLAGKHLKKSVLELGGSNAFIVLKDADLQQAAIDACYSRFRDAGQSCNAAKRLIVEDSVADQFVALLLEQSRLLTMGNPMQASTSLAPLHLANASEMMQSYVDEAVVLGAQCLLGGYIPEQKQFYPATLLDYVSINARVVKEEVFGPVLPILRVKNIDEAIELANHSNFGLGAAIYSQDTEQAWHYARKIEAGSVFINRHTSSDLRLPFGGIKDSGFGRELSEFGLYEFVNIKSYWQK